MPWFSIKNSGIREEIVWILAIIFGVCWKRDSSMVCPIRVSLKVSRSFKSNPANTPRVFLVERIWKRRFPRFFKVKYACYICREESNGNKGGNFTLPLSVLILWLNLCVSDAVINDEKNTHKLYTKKVFSMNDSFSGCEQVHSIIWSCFKLTVKL